MIEKIVKNKSVIAIILSILAMALVAPDIINTFNQSINDSWPTLVLYGTVVVSAVFILILGLTKKEFGIKSLLLPVIFLYSGTIINLVRNIIEFNTWSSVYYLALYSALLIAYILLMLNNNKTLKYVLYVLFLIVLCMSLLAVFNGSQTGLARFVLGLIIIGNVYLELDYKKKEEEKNEEN